LDRIGRGILAVVVCIQLLEARAQRTGARGAGCVSGVPRWACAIIRNDYHGRRYLALILRSATRHLPGKLPRFYISRRNEQRSAPRAPDPAPRTA
jgi:hypothetical protein